MFLFILLRSFALVSIYRPFLHLSGRVNHYARLAEQLAVRASPEQFKGDSFGRLVSLEDLLILTLLVRAPVALRLRHVKQLDDFLLQGSPLRQLLISGVLLLGLSRPALRDAEFWGGRILYKNLSHLVVEKYFVVLVYFDNCMFGDFIR